MISHEPLVASQVFRIEELALHLFKACDKLRDRASLALTCSHLFRLLVPRLWQNVRGIDRLFVLIPGVFLEKYAVSSDSRSRPGQRLKIVGRSCTGWPACLSLTIFPPKVIPKPPHRNDLSRFRMYCSFVKRLDIISSGITLDLYNSDAISSLADPCQILLPNLLSLELSSFAGYRGDQILWISDLFSPCLRSLRIGIGGDMGPAFATPDECNMVLDILAQRCPHLRELDLTIHPRDLGMPHGEGPDLRRWFEHRFDVSRMTALRHLTVSAVYVGAGGLEVFGTLPLLETLKLTLLALPHPNLIPDILSEGSYPSLLSLFLYSVKSLETLGRIWKLFSRIRRLTSLRVDYWLPRLDHAQHDVVCVLNREISRAENLTLCQSLGRTFDNPAIGTILTVEPLSAFPLRTLRIIIVEKTPLDVDRLLNELRRTTFSSLQTFSLSGIPLTFGLLAAFAYSMPALERLEGQINFSSIDSIPPSVKRASATFRTLMIDIWDERMEIIETSIHARFLDSGNDTEVVRFLSALWRNVRIEIKTKEVVLNEERKLELKAASRAAELLNREIASLARPST